MDINEEKDERIFSSTDMHDFALRIARRAADAVHEGAHDIDGLTLEQYVERELKDEPGQ